MTQELEERIESKNQDRRDLFAAAALTGLLAGRAAGEQWWESGSMAVRAWQLANAMIEAGES